MAFVILCGRVYSDYVRQHKEKFSTRTGGNMNTKLDVTRRQIAPIVFELAENVDVAFEKVLLCFLKKAAESGMDLEQVTVTVFDEVFASRDNDEFFDGTLSSFMNLLMEEVHLRRRFGNAVLDVIMPATVMGQDIYELIDHLEANIKLKPSLRMIGSKMLPVLQPQRDSVVVYGNLDRNHNRGSKAS